MSDNPNIVVLTAANFESEVIRSSKPVVVEFWTEGCRPCQKLAPVVRRYAGRLKVAPCNVDEYPELADRYGVLTIPTLLFFKNGLVVDRAMGTFNEISTDEVAAKCDEFIAEA